jgi:hypothetical protein
MNKIDPIVFQKNQSENELYELYGVGICENVRVPNAPSMDA